MTLKEFKKHIDRLVKNGHGNLTVVAASDEEGNSYDDIYLTPSVMKVDDMDCYGGKGKDTVICVN
jgi:hypothetical protein